MAFTDLTLDQMVACIGEHTREEFNFNAISNRGWVGYLTMSFPEVFCDRGDGKVSYNVLNELNEVAVDKYFDQIIQSCNYLYISAGDA